MLHKEWLHETASLHKGYNVVRVSQAEAERADLWQQVYELEAQLRAEQDRDRKREIERKLAALKHALERNARDSEQWQPPSL